MKVCKSKLLGIEAYTINETAKKLGYKSTKTIYRLLNKTPRPYRDIFGMNIQMLSAEKIYLMPEPTNLVSLADKIKANIQVIKNNIIRKNR